MLQGLQSCRNSFSADPLTLLIIQESAWLARTIFLWSLLHVDSPKSASLEKENKTLTVSSLCVCVLWSGQRALWVGFRAAIVYPVRWRNTTSHLRIYLRCLTDCRYDNYTKLLAVVRSLCQNSQLKIIVSDIAKTKVAWPTPSVVSLKLHKAFVSFGGTFSPVFVS